MTWVLRSIVDLFNAVAAWYLQRKYGAAARRLGRPPAEEDGRRGFIILEIDGLAHTYLRQALKQGSMPYLARLLIRRRFRLIRWYCGLPSTTPASQAGIMYGNTWDIPGFRWYDKATDDPIVCKAPGDVRALQDRVSRGRAGLLRGGASYTNMFDGDARLALFTLSAVGRDRLLENVRGIGFLLLFALSALRLLKVIGLSLWTWLSYVAKRTRALVLPSTPHFTFFGPLYQILNNIVFREVTTFSVMVDIYRGMPSIYASYTGYDEIAHHFGVQSKEAFRALRGIDGQIRQIDRIRQLYRRREYDLYILSDHGMTPSIPFRRVYGQSLQEFIADHTGEEIRGAAEEAEAPELGHARIHSLLDELRGLEARPHRALTAQWLRLARQRLEQKLRAPTPDAEWDWTRRGDVVVRNSGPLSHVYFRVTERAMDLSELTALHPTLVEALVGHEGIGLVVGREGEEVAIVGRVGTLWMGPQGLRLVGDDPLGAYPNSGRAAEQIERLARFPHAGDLILFGAWDGNEVVSFEDQVATHGGLGGDQLWPFIAFPHRDMAGVAIEGPEEIYTRLVRTYGTYG